MYWLLSASLALAGDRTTFRLFGPLHERDLLDGVWTAGDASAFGDIVFRARGTLFDFDPTWTESVAGAHAALAHRARAGAVAVDAVVALGLGSQGGSDSGLTERGSHLRAGWASPDGDDVSLTLWPLDGDRFRAGYAVDLGWGATYAEPSCRRPAARLSWRRGAHYAYAGARAGLQDRVDADTLATAPGAFPGFLAGGGVAAGEHLRLDVGGGRIAQGQLLATAPVDGADYGAVVHLTGASARATLLLGGARPPDDPLRLVPLDGGFAPQWRTPGAERPGLTVAAEGAWLHQRLLGADGDVGPEYGHAGAVEIVGALPRWTASVDATLRDEAFLGAPTMGSPAGQASPDGTTTAELGLRGVVSAAVPSLELVSVLGGRVLRPATRCPGGDACVTIASPTEVEPLPDGQAVSPVVSAVVGAQWRPMPAANLSAELGWTLDPNQSELVVTDEVAAYRPIEHVARGDLAVHLMYAASF